MPQAEYVLNRFFTRDILLELISGRPSTIITSVFNSFFPDGSEKSVSDLITSLYKHLSRSYRNEYFYTNTLVNKLLYGVHNTRTASAIRQLPVHHSKADFVLFNGKAVVYEIKTDLDSFDRLQSQLSDYYMGFDHVCLLISEKRFEQAMELLQDSPVGIKVLTKKGTLSKRLVREPVMFRDSLDHTVIFKMLRKYEYENVLKECYASLPDVPPAFYFSECLDWFSQIPIDTAYQLSMKQLKKRNLVKPVELELVPQELRSLAYFSSLTPNMIARLDQILKSSLGDMLQLTQQKDWQ